MTTWGTVRQQIAEELGKPNDGPLIDRALAESLRWHRQTQTFFNQATGEFVTEAGRWSYPVPSDFITLIGPLYHAPSRTATLRRPLRVETVDYVETNRYSTTSASDGPFLLTGRPTSYSISGDQFLLVPVPDQSDEVVDFRYVQDLGTPTVRFGVEGWTIVDDVGQAITDSFSNGWLEHAQDLIRTRAIYYLQNRVYKNDRGTQAALMDWAEHEASMRRESNRRRGRRRIRGWF